MLQKDANKGKADVRETPRVPQGAGMPGAVPRVSLNIITGS